MWLPEVNSGKVQCLINLENCNIFHKLKTKCLPYQSQPSAVAYTDLPITKGCRGKSCTSTTVRPVNSIVVERKSFK